MRAWTILTLAVFVGCLGGVRAGDKADPIRINGTLQESDPTDKTFPKAKFQVKKQALKAGVYYRLDLKSDEFDAFLRVEDEKGKILAYDDDNGGNSNARVIFKPKVDDKYRLIITTYDKKTGAYELTIQDATKEEILFAKVRELPSLPSDEREAVVRHFKKNLEGQNGKIALKEMRPIAMLLQNLEHIKDSKIAAKHIGDFSKILAGADDEKIQKYAESLTGVVRRLHLPGNPIDVRGVTLEGKEFKWSRYRGKVVLVDFWATWCGPCIAEIPNMKKMYDRYHDRGFDVVAISIDHGDKEKVIKFTEKRELPWVCLFDDELPKGERLSQVYGVNSIPQAILVGRDGNVVSLHARGPELERLLEQLIGPAEKTP